MIIDDFELPSDSPNERGTMVVFRYENNHLEVKTFQQGKTVLEKVFKIKEADKAVSFYKKECTRRGFCWLASHHEEIRK